MAPLPTGRRAGLRPAAGGHPEANPIRPRRPGNGAARAASLSRRALVLLIRGYQITFSALLGRQCRYLPSCSDYAADAIGRHGVWPGAWMAAARLCRCHPWGAWGYDPVPRRCEPVPALQPWRHGVWRMPAVTGPPADGPDQERASSSAAKP